MSPCCSAPPPASKAESSMPTSAAPSTQQDGPLNSEDKTGLEGLAKLALVPLVAEAPRPPVGPALPRTPRFGPPGVVSAEQTCPYVHIYMRAFGRQMEKRRATLHPSAPVAAARAAFERLSGGTLRQEDTRDEDGYIISGGELDMPLWSFSSGCNLNLNFTPAVSRSLAQEPDVGQGAGSGRNVFV